LIDKALIGGSVQNQFKIYLSNGTVGYIDIIYFKENEVVVIELKKETIIKKDLSQLSEYVHCIKKLYPGKSIRGILIGQYLDDNLKVFLDLMGLFLKVIFTIFLYA
jgi:RecB family endonuclease NucS